MRVETYINEMKNAVDKIWEGYGDISYLPELLYAERGLGAMQRLELKEITEYIVRLKKRIDDLAEECTEIPVLPS